jgi:glycosyltransferase involved in cell wall biosynthesis
MRILVISNFYPPYIVGGYERLCSNVVAALRARGHQVRVIAGAPRLPLEQPLPRDPDTLHVLRIADFFSQDYYSSAGLLRRRLIEAASHFIDAANVHALSEQIDIFAPDVAYVWNLHGIGGLGMLAAIEYRAMPWVCHLGDAVPRFLCTLDARPLGPLAQAVGRSLSGSWITLSRRLIDEIQRDGPQLTGSIELLPGILPDEEDPPCAEQYRPGETLRLVFHGRVTRQKGVGILIDALARLRDEGINQVELDVIGHVYNPELREQASKDRLGDRVHFLPSLKREQVMHRMQRYHVAAFATEEREPFGLAPLEGAAAGCVPLISEDCGIAEWLVDGVHCVKAPADAEGFATAIRRIVSGEIDLVPLARRARAAALRDFRASSIAPRVEAILERAAMQRGPLRGSTVLAHRAALVAEHIIGATIERAVAA